MFNAKFIFYDETKDLFTFSLDNFKTVAAIEKMRNNLRRNNPGYFVRVVIDELQQQLQSAGYPYSPNERLGKI